MNCNHAKELSEMISQVEELHFQLMEMREAEEHTRASASPTPSQNSKCAT